MYRIITSTTKEEHFESPAAAAFGMTNYCIGNTLPNIGTTAGSELVSTLKVLPKSNTNPYVDSTMYHGDYDVYGDLYVHGNIYARNFSVESENEIEETITVLETDPTSNSWVGSTGSIAFSANYAYLCTGNNTWVRWKINSTW